MRTIEGGDGRSWEVFLEWEGRKPLHQALRQMRRHREARARKRGEGNRLELLDGCGDVTMFDELPIVAVVAVIFLVLVLFGPFLFAVLFAVIELGLIVLAALLAIGARTLFGRPWRAVAVADDGALWAWRQKGFVRARKLVHHVADAVAAGQPAGTIAVDRLEAGMPVTVAADADLGPLGDLRFRWAAALVAVAAVVAGVIVLVAG